MLLQINKDLIVETDNVKRFRVSDNFVYIKYAGEDHAAEETYPLAAEDRQRLMAAVAFGGAANRMSTTMGRK
jgi:hypothetical protein